MSFGQGQRAVVLDASAAIPFLEGDPAWGDRVRDWVRADAMLLVPPHFGVEIANALLRGSSITSVDYVVALIRDLFAIGLEVADRGLPGLEGSVRLADRHQLTVYDAAYLDVALDVDGELATRDRALRTAAEAEGVRLVG